MKKLLVLCVAGFAGLIALTTSADAVRLNCRDAQSTEWTITQGEGDFAYAVGTPDKDVFVARDIDHPGPFIIFGLEGNDIICGSRGPDVIYGGPGDDTIVGRGGPDVIYGEKGNDDLRGGRGPDRVKGGPGDDFIKSSKIDTVDPGKSEPPTSKIKPTTKPTAKPTAKTTTKPTAKPTAKPTTPPVPQPTATPSATSQPTTGPTVTPSVTPSPSATVTPPPQPPSAGTFSVVGRQIIDPSGDVFYPIGANVSPPLRDSAGDCIWWLSLRCSDMTGRLGSVQAWNWNTLRLNLQCGNENNIVTGAPYGPAEMFAATDQIVDEYTAAGIVVMLDCHPYMNQNPAVGSATWDELTSFWDEAVDRYGDNPYVWINFVNEYEATGGWDDAYFKQFTAAAHSHLKNAGYTGIMVMDLPNWAQHIQFFDEPENVAWSKQFDNVVWDWHAYGAVSHDGTVASVTRDMGYAEMSGLYDDILANLAANEIPVIVGEFGHDWNDQRRTDGGWSYISMVNSARLNIERLPAAGIGMTVWHGNGSSGVVMEYGLKASDDLTFDEPTVNSNLSDLGELYWALTQSLS